MIFSAEEMDEIRIDLRRTDGNVNLVAQLHACSAACIRAVQNGQTLVAGRRAGADGRERNSKRLWTEADCRKLQQMTAEGCALMILPAPWAEAPMRCTTEFITKGNGWSYVRCFAVHYGE